MMRSRAITVRLERVGAPRRRPAARQLGVARPSAPRSRSSMRCAQRLSSRRTACTRPEALRASGLPVESVRSGRRCSGTTAAPPRSAGSAQPRGDQQRHVEEQLPVVERVGAAVAEVDVLVAASGCPPASGSAGPGRTPDGSSIRPLVVEREKARRSPDGSARRMNSGTRGWKNVSNRHPLAESCGEQPGDQVRAAIVLEEEREREVDLADPGPPRAT